MAFGPPPVQLAFGGAPRPVHISASIACQNAVGCRHSRRRSRSSRRRSSPLSTLHDRSVLPTAPAHSDDSEGHISHVARCAIDAPSRTAGGLPRAGFGESAKYMRVLGPRCLRGVFRDDSCMNVICLSASTSGVRKSSVFTEQPHANQKPLPSVHVLPISCESRVVLFAEGPECRRPSRTSSSAAAREIYKSASTVF